MTRICKGFIYLSFLLISLFSGASAFADGSRDLYPTGATGARAFLVSTGLDRYTNSSAANSYAFPTLGTHYVYAKVGETIYVGSSAQNVNSGRIRLIAPNGDSYETIANNTGRIVNRTQELNGPNRTGVTNGYAAFSQDVTAGSEGVWRIEFIPPAGLNRDGASAPNPSVAANATWSQPTGNSTNLIAAWDVSVGVTGNGNLIPGRVYTNVLNMTLTTNASTGFQEASSFFGTTYVLTKDGNIYRVKGNGFQGMYYTFFVNNVGFYAPDLEGNAWTGADWSNAKPTAIPSYKSFDYSNYGDLIDKGKGPWLQDPRKTDSRTGITHKMFYTIPSNYANWDLPKEADVLINKNLVAADKEKTWLKINETVIPEILSFTVVGVEGEGQQASNKGAFIHFEANLAGTVRIEIKPDPTSGVNFAPRTIIGVAEAGPNNSVYWDGKDGNGIVLPPGVLPTIITLRLQGAEVHFPYLDMEINPNGLIIERLNPANLSAVLSDKVYWDDSRITLINGTSSASKPTNAIHPDPKVVDMLGLGESSNSNGHKWGLHGVTAGTSATQAGYTGRTNYNHGFGNERGIDTYTFILGDENSRGDQIRSLIIDLNVLNIGYDLTDTEVMPGDNWTYTSEITNSGLSHALAEYDSLGNLIESTGSFFEFYFPEGVVPNDLTLADIAVTVINPASGGARMVPEFTPVYLYDNEVGKWKVKMMVDLPVDAVLKIGIPVVLGPTVNPGTDLIAWASLLRPHDVSDVDATNISWDANGDPISPTNAFFECQGDTPNATNPIIFDPNDYNPIDPIPCNNVKINMDLSVLVAPEISLVKKVKNDPSVILKKDDIIEYEFTVENTGNVDLSNVDLKDDLVGVFNMSGPGITDINSDGILSPGEVWTYTASYTVKVADVSVGSVTNGASVEAEYTENAGGTLKETASVKVNVSSGLLITNPMIRQRTK